MVIRPVCDADHDAVWEILEPTIRAGETYALPRDYSRAEALEYWCAVGHEVFVADEDGRVVGTYFLCANARRGGAHVANCGYMTAAREAGRGVAGAMCRHSLEQASRRGFRAMQFNFVVTTNERAIRLWERLGFERVGRLPEAFFHPMRGYVDVLLMYRRLTPA